MAFTFMESGPGTIRGDKSRFIDGEKDGELVSRYKSARVN